VLDDVERRRFLVEPAGKCPVPALVRSLHVELDESPGEPLFLPRSSGFARAEPDDCVLDPQRLAGLERDVANDSVALVEEPQDRDPIRHRRDAGDICGGGRKPLVGLRFLIGLRRLIFAATAAGERQHSGSQDECSSHA
jgi:hypothetical protein